MDDIDNDAIEDAPQRSRVAVVDGRTARRRRNRTAVLDALIELASEGQPEPTIEVIAERAGVSYRSVYRYFEDRTELMLAAIGRLMSDFWSVLDPEQAVGGTLDERIAGLVGERIRIFRKLAPLTRAAVHRRVHEPLVAEHYDRIRDLLRDRLAAQFEPELANLPDDERTLALASIEVAFQFEALDYLVQREAMTDAQLQQVLARQVRAQLATDALRLV